MPKTTHAPWYKEHFDPHPRYATRARCAWTGASENIHGKRKVWCRLCLERCTVEAEGNDLFPTAEGVMDAVRTREAILDNCEY